MVEDATIVGNVTLRKGCSVWHKAVLRGDQNSITVDKGTNIQDLVMVHVDTENSAHLGEDVTVGHGAVVHGCEIGEKTIVGINSTVLSGAVIGKGSIIGANALVTSGTEIPPYSIAMGVPAEVVKEGDKSLIEKTKVNAEHYHKLRDEHREGKYERYS